MTMFQGRLLWRPIYSGRPCCLLLFLGFWAHLGLLEVSLPHYFQQPFNLKYASVRILCRAECCRISDDILFIAR